MSRQSLGLGLLVSGFLLAMGGCGSSSTPATTTGGGTTTGQGGGTTSTTTSTSSTNTGTGGTGTGGGGTAGGGTAGGGTGGAGGAAGNHDFASATPVDVNAQTATAAALVDATTKDFYKFTGKAGDRLTFIVKAQGLVANNTGNDDTIIDPVVTLWDSQQNQIAQDDDAWPRFGRDPQLFTILPADGDYYVSIEDCGSAFGPNNCAPPDGILTFDYELNVVTTDKLNAPEVWAGSSQDGTTAKAVPIAYAVPSGGTPGGYGIYILDGAFKAAGETHVFSFTPPKDTTVDPTQRPHAELWVQPISSNNGDGSTANVNVWIVDSLDLATTIASVDQKNYSDGDSQTSAPIAMSVPVELEHEYFVFMQSEASPAVPATDFYFAEHYVGGFYYGQLEANPDANDDLAKPETLTTPANATAGAYFVDGDISKAGTDVDNYELTVPADANTVSLYCSAQRAGSGLRGFQATVLGADGKTILANATEVANAEMSASQKKVAVGTTKAFLQVSAATQDAAVAGTFYHCTVVFSKL